ncbi:MAG: SAM domain-containing protein [Spirochaetaceae bacterium]|nr:SAM domain-containing protein [Spirochaetaceae bacterium]
MDDKLKGAKIFQQAIEIPVAINENGYIGINPYSYSVKIFNINEVTEYKITTGDTKKNTAGSIGAGALLGGLGGALLGGLLGAGATGSYASSASGRTTMLGGLGAASGALIGADAPEKISEIDLIFKMNDFNNPFISVPLLSSSIKINSNRFKELQVEIQSIMSTLDFLWNNKKNILPPSNQISQICGVEKKWNDILRENNLDEYIDIFEKNKLTDLEIISELTEDDLEKIGIIAMGDRRRMLKLFSGINIYKEFIPTHRVRSFPTGSYGMELRKEPNVSIDHFAVIPNGAEVQHISTGDDITLTNTWFEIITKDEKRGWCFSRSLEKI